MDPVSAARAAVGLTVDAVTHVAAQRRLETLMWKRRGNRRFDG